MAELRPATHHDLPDILDFWQNAAENSNRPADSTTALQTLLTRDPEALTLAVEHGRIVGTVIAGFDGWRHHLYRLAVAPDRRRQGIATRLLEHAEQRLRTLGATRADAMILDENHSAHALWQSRGYQPQQEWSRWVKPL